MNRNKLNRNKILKNNKKSSNNKFRFKIAKNNCLKNRQAYK
jgi:hypothetical protein